MELKQGKYRDMLVLVVPDQGPIIDGAKIRWYIKQSLVKPHGTGRFNSME